jgi:hypothetical protein
MGFHCNDKSPAGGERVGRLQRLVAVRFGGCQFGESNPMTKEDDYRKNAAETLELAHRAGTSADKGRLLALAEKWLDLSNRTRRIARQHIGRVRQEHPLVRSRLPDFSLNAD